MRILALLLLLSSAEARSLIVVDQPGCPTCIRFWSEAHDLGMPVRRITLPHWPLKTARPYFTPTFIVMDEGRETLRILGYTDRQSLLRLLR